MPKPAELKTDAMPVACFAPPLTDELIARYEAIVAKCRAFDTTGLPNAISDGESSFAVSADDWHAAAAEWTDALDKLLACVKLWWELPESTGTADDQKLKIRHRGKDVRVKITALTPDLVKQLWDAVPWAYELNAMQALFDTIPDESKVLRDAAFHLLWYVKELEKDREPLTADRLPG